MRVDTVPMLHKCYTNVTQMLLCICVTQVVREMSRDSSLRTAVLVGGDAMEAQFAELAHNPDVIVATPGESCPPAVAS